MVLLRLILEQIQTKRKKAYRSKCPLCYYIVDAFIILTLIYIQSWEK